MTKKDDDIAQARKQIETTRLQTKSRKEAGIESESYFARNKQVRSNFIKLSEAHNYFPLGYQSSNTMSRLTYSNSLSEPELGVYVNSGYQRARNAYASGFRGWNTKYQIGFATVIVDLYGRAVRVQVQGNDSFYFEFIGSSMPVTTGTAGGFKTYIPVTVGVDVKVSNGAITPVAEIREGKRGELITDTLIDPTSIINRGWQVNLNTEPVSSPYGEKQLNRRRYPKMLMESWAPVHAHHSAHLRNVSWCYDERIAEYWIDENDWRAFWAVNMNRTRRRGGYMTHFSRDIDYDVPWETGHNFENVIMAYLMGSTDWPRANGLQQVASKEFGAREFAVYVDAFSQFWVFPTAAIQPLTGLSQNVPPGVVQQVMYTKPTWAFMAPGKFKDYYPAAPHPWTDYPETDWKANHDGTKFAAIVYERSPFIFDSAYYSTGVGPYPFTVTEFNRLRDEMGSEGRYATTPGDNAHATQRYYVAPGVIELDIKIEITGHELSNYTVTGTLREVRRPATAEKCAFAVGYVWHNIPLGCEDKDPKRVAKPGDLVVLDVEQWAKPGVRELPLQLATIIKDDLTVPGGKVLFSTSVPMQINAIDLQTLSFAARVDNFIFDEQSKPGVPPFPAPNKVDMETLHFGIWVVVGLVSKEILFPETMTQANKDLITAMVKNGQKGREEAAARDMYLVPMNESRGWSDAAMANCRDFLTQYGQLYHKAVSGLPETPAITATLTQWYWEWCSSNTVAYSIYATVPKFGWQCYADLICQYLSMASPTSFYVHPSGTWCYWDNQHIYNPHGACYTFQYSTVNQYDVWDPKKIEHCIFDRVHFEVRNTKAIIARHNTTFLKLHNDGVKATKKTGKLQANIFEIQPADMRAKFTKEPFYYDVDSDRHGLFAVATWDSGEYLLFDTFVQGGGAKDGEISQGLLSIEMSFGGLWIDRSFMTIQPTNDHAHFHVRFADPLVIDAVNKEKGNG